MMFAKIDMKQKRAFKYRICKICNRKFEKDGKYQRVCNTCNKLHQNLRDVCPGEKCIEKIIKDNYLEKDKIIDTFKNIDELIISKQLWYEDESTNKRHLVMRTNDILQLLEAEKKRLEI